MGELVFDEGLVTIVDDPVDACSVERALSEPLLARGFVRETFPQAILDRETAFPTGLDAGGINVAMPHCDVEHIVRGALSVGVLRRPVPWHRMDDPASTCDVSVVVMLALNEAHAHLEMLQKVVALIQDQDLMRRIVGSSNPEEAFGLMSTRLA